MSERRRDEATRRIPGQHTPSTCFVKGTAPSTTRDLEEVIRRVRDALPGIKWKQLSVILPADDDGLWYFWLPDLPGEVQIESSQGVCPFLVETDKHDARFTAHSPAETADTIIRWLELPGGREKELFTCGR